MSITLSPPLSLYVHLPWCVRKCPYCDFNSHAARTEIPEERYIKALLADLALDAKRVEGRAVQTIFFGGGTPSLFSPDSIARLLSGIRDRVAVANEAEITLEANPGTVELGRFRGFREAGVNRLSIGIQSFEEEKLKALGRIHGRNEALAAAEAASSAGFTNFNLDLMYALPHQTKEQALADVDTAIALRPTHLSVYQLTLEPNTLFHRNPPALPDETTIDLAQEALTDRLNGKGYRQYEVSAYALSGYQCRHNRNYWEFGDYLGIGAGAHGKISTRGVRRIAKSRHPDAYLQMAGSSVAYTSDNEVENSDLAFEFMLNALRLVDGFSLALFVERTGLQLAAIQPALELAVKKNLIEIVDDHVVPTELGRRFLNDLTALFLPARTSP